MVAVIFTGEVRSLLTDAVLANFVALFGELERFNMEVHIFAVLDLHSSNKVSRERGRVQFRFRETQVCQGLASLGVPYQARFVKAGGVACEDHAALCETKQVCKWFHSACAAAAQTPPSFTCAGTRGQLCKNAIAYSLMARDEHNSGNIYRYVMRLRNDELLAPHPNTKALANMLYLGIGSHAIVHDDTDAVMSRDVAGYYFGSITLDPLMFACFRPASHPGSTQHHPGKQNRHR